MLLSVQNGMSTPEDWSIVVVLMFARLPVSQIATWRSLILLKPVVAMRSLSPNHVIRAPCAESNAYPKAPVTRARTLIPVWPSPVRTASPPARGSKKRILRSLQVVARRVPVGFQARLWMASAWPPNVIFALSGLARSQILTTWSPVVVARTLFAVGWKRTWPTRRGETSMRATGSKSWGSQPSWPQPSNAEDSTDQMRALPSSPAEATTASLKGDQSVSRTGPAWPRARGMRSGSLEERPCSAKGVGRGRMAKAPPPDAFQLREMYRCGRVSAQAHGERAGTDGGGGDDVGVPCAVGDLYVVVPVLLLALLAKDMAARPQPGATARAQSEGAYRYLDARTKRDMTRKSEVVRAAAGRGREGERVNHDARVVAARTAFRLSPRP